MKFLFATTLILTALLGASLSAADSIDLNVKNLAIEKLRERMATRAGKVNGWKDKLAIGEEATGLINDRQLAGLSLSEKKEVRDLIAAENEDRYALFREIRIAHNIPESDLSKVAAAFSEAQRAAAAPGHMVQNPADQKWVAKKDLK
ncbi:MAG TPA: DUF1318 domain-containing protein [Planctomycetota bacterium]|nr:DUF1318 domain-containing protein [Planctomycetota bacterium]